MLTRPAFILVTTAIGLSAATSFPSITYSTYLRDHFTPTAIATDSSGNIYLAGNAVVDAPGSQTTVLVLKLNPTATQYVYTRFIGGSVNDSVAGIAVDGAGNAYIAGVTNSPDFPMTASTGSTPPGSSQERSYVAKLNATGELVYSMFLGGATNSFAQAVAVNASGAAIVSGTTVGTSESPYLTEVNPAGTAIVFSTAQVGGSALAVDAAGNIYMSGTTGSLTYPTTPGTYQPMFPVFLTCIAPCMAQFQGYNQYVTKVDPTGTIIFSTAVSGTGNTANNGLAVDVAGNVYLTGVAGVGYPYTVTAPTAPTSIAFGKLETPALPFLTKLDPLGQDVLYSVPVGGAGVTVDANGSAYAGGILGSFANYNISATLPALANLPAGCFTPEATVGQQAYAAQVDSSGDVTGAQFIGGSTLQVNGVALAGRTLWLAGATEKADFAFSPGVMFSENLQVAALAGAYLGAVNFSATAPAAGTPQIGCVVDSGELEPTGPVAPNQLITIFGNGLGPATGVAATNYTTTSLGGVSVTFGGTAATLLYVSANQINVAVPMVPNGRPTVMTVTVNSVPSAQLEFPVAVANPTMFAVPGGFQFNFGEFDVAALNADGTLNSATNPARLGSVIQVFVDGLALSPQSPGVPSALLSGGGFVVAGYTQANPFVLDVSLEVPSSAANFACQGVNTTTVCRAGFFFDLETYLEVYLGTPLPTGGLGFGGTVYLNPASVSTMGRSSR
jgi:uncharacterized protein (TIGR03437 family)